MAAFDLRPDSVRANPDTTTIDSKRDASRPAPIVPAGRHSLAAFATRAPLHHRLAQIFTRRISAARHADAAA